MKAEDLKHIVKEKYGKIANNATLQVQTSCCGTSGCSGEPEISMIGDEYKNVEKYANVVDLEAIKENDYNLNISRYVDTSEEEEEVDIEAVIDEINELGIKGKEIGLKLNGYLKELGFEEIQ